MKMKVLVLGGCGFLGSHLTNVLVEQGHQVRVFDRLNASVRNLTKNLGQVELCYGDFSDEHSLSEVLTGIDVVFHLITTTFPSTTIKSGVYDLESNVIPMLKMLEICRSNKVKKVVFTSSGGTVYGEYQGKPFLESATAAPRTLYGLSKLTCENYLELFCNHHNIEYSICRISNLYGPFQNLFGVQGLIAVTIGNLLINKPAEVWGNGENIRDYVFVTDVVKALISSMHYSGEHKKINIGSGEGVSVNEVLDCIQRVSCRSIDRDYLDSANGFVNVNILDTTLAKNVLNWEPRVSLEEGISHTWEWAKREV